MHDVHFRAITIIIEGGRDARWRARSAREVRCSSNPIRFGLFHSTGQARARVYSN